jgi:hypothetical protein
MIFALFAHVMLGKDVRVSVLTQSDTDITPTSEMASSQELLSNSVQVRNSYDHCEHLAYMPALISSLYSCCYFRISRVSTLGPMHSKRLDKLSYSECKMGKLCHPESVLSGLPRDKYTTSVCPLGVDNLKIDNTCPHLADSFELLMPTFARSRSSFNPSPMCAL